MVWVGLGFLRSPSLVEIGRSLKGSVRWVCEGIPRKQHRAIGPEFSEWWWFQHFFRNFHPEIWGVSWFNFTCAYLSKHVGWFNHQLDSAIEIADEIHLYCGFRHVFPSILFHGFFKGSKAINCQNIWSHKMTTHWRLGVWGEVETHPLWLFPSFLVPSGIN